MNMHKVLTLRAYENFVNPGHYAGPKFDVDRFDIVKHVAIMLPVYEVQSSPEIEEEIKTYWHQLCNKD